MHISSFNELRNIIYSDAYRYIGDSNFHSRCTLYFKTIGFRYTFWLRTNRFLSQYKWLYPIRVFASLYLKHLSYKSGIQIPYMTQIGRGFYIGHYGTIIINGKTIIGNNVNISPDVVIGRTNRGDHIGIPVIGDEVYIGPGAKIIGAITIGSNVAIGANAVVTKDVPNNACVGGIPAQIINMKGSEGYINRKIRETCYSNKLTE